MVKVHHVQMVMAGQEKDVRMTVGMKTLDPAWKMVAAPPPSHWE